MKFDEIDFTLHGALEICRRRSPEPRSECPNVGGRDEVMVELVESMDVN